MCRRGPRLVSLHGNQEQVFSACREGRLGTRRRDTDAALKSLRPRRDKAVTVPGVDSSLIRDWLPLGRQFSLRCRSRTSPTGYEGASRGLWMAGSTPTAESGSVPNSTVSDQKRPPGAEAQAWQPEVTSSRKVAPGHMQGLPDHTRGVCGSRSRGQKRALLTFGGAPLTHWAREQTQDHTFLTVAAQHPERKLQKVPEKRSGQVIGTRAGQVRLQPQIWKPGPPVLAKCAYSPKSGSLAPSEPLQQGQKQGVNSTTTSSDGPPTGLVWASSVLGSAASRAAHPPAVLTAAPAEGSTG
ncbi:hypothetical protein CB1_000614003 [Camelus ferus]|nr:hypothetical protein CB1_000614003 [Camelus ferus]